MAYFESAISKFLHLSADCRAYMYTVYRAMRRCSD